MRHVWTHILFALLSVSIIGCTNELDENTGGQEIPSEPPTDEEEEEEEEEPMPDIYEDEHFYEAPDENMPEVTFMGSTSADFNSFLKAQANQGSVRIIIPKDIYSWNDINLQSDLHLQFEDGTIIKPEDGNTRRIFNLGGNGSDDSRIENVSISSDGRFTIDISDPMHTNKNTVAVRVGRVNNFCISDFDILDRRSYVASLTIAYIPGSNETEPFATNGVIKSLTQKNAHTGYGLVQLYAGENILFKDLYCEGGVTLRFETDDRQMKDEIKFGQKTGGIEDIFAYDIRGENGITPLMFSPHFTTNGQVTIQKVEATGCAFAVRVKQGFVELFDEDMQFPTTDTEQRDLFRQFIEDQFDLPAGVQATAANPYKRNNGKQWAVRLSGAGVMAPRNEYVSAQLGQLEAGGFYNSTVTDVRANYKSSGAKIKQEYLKYIPCPQWNFLRNPGTSLGMGNGFEYHGPSVALSVDNTDGTTVAGNYIIKVMGESFNDFPSTFYKNIYIDTEAKCDNRPNTIPVYTAPF